MGRPRLRGTVSVLVLAAAFAFGAACGGPKPKAVPPLELTPAPAEAPATIFTSIAAGSAHTCALTKPGRVMCWGVNRNDQLGVEPRGDRERRAFEVEGLSDVKAIAAGGDFNCALTDAAGVKCWGDNDRGQLGDGTTRERYEPRDVIGLTAGVKAIATGGAHACALTQAGGVKCWGSNVAGQLGDGTRTPRGEPGDVAGLTRGVQAVFAAAASTCALMDAGGFKCWGDPFVSVRGSSGSRIEAQRTAPADSPELGVDAKELVFGGGFACLLTTTGGVRCLGYNAAGQLGNGAENDSRELVEVAGLGQGAATLAAGSYHACAVTSAGAARCWGKVQIDALRGIEVESAMSNPVYGPAPVAIAGLESGVAALAAGREYACALMTAGNVRCWGHNYLGQLGNGSILGRDAPDDLRVAR